MSSLLLVTPVARLQQEISSTVSSFASPGVYVSLNKSQKAAATALTKSGVTLTDVFFIDCVASESGTDDVITVKPTDLDTLAYTIRSFIKEITGKKFVLLDSLATLLIYNDMKRVAQFVKAITEYASDQDVSLVALSQKTTGEQLLDTIFNFFDTVKQ